MKKYKVLKSYPKIINNAGRLVTLKKGINIYLKSEPDIIRLTLEGFIKEIVDIKSKPAPIKTKPIKEDKKYKAKKEAETLEQE